MTYQELKQSAAWDQLTVNEKRFVRGAWRSKIARDQVRIEVAVARATRATRKAEAMAKLKQTNAP